MRRFFVRHKGQVVYNQYEAWYNCGEIKKEKADISVLQSYI